MDGGSFKLQDQQGFSEANPNSGLTSATTMALFNTIRDAVIPELALTHCFDVAEQLPIRSKLVPPVTARDIGHLQRLVLGEYCAGALQFLRKQRSRGVPTEVLALELLGGTAASLGQCWAKDVLGFEDVTLGTGRLLELLAHLDFLSRFDVGQTLMNNVNHLSVRPSVLLADAPGGQHTLGLRIVDFLLRRRGFAARVLSPPNEAQLALQLSGHWFDAVGFSVSHETQLAGVKQQIELAKQVSMNTNLVVFLGGSLIVRCPELCFDCGADLITHNAQAMASQLAQLLGLAVRQESKAAT
jgi:MerR family transcriptional regulator, light-induced transcriptional regulator